MADTSKSPTLPPAEEGEVKYNQQSADLGSPNSEEMRERAEELLPDRTDVEKAYKEQLTTDDAQKEAKASLKISELSLDSPETPSGYGLKKAAGESNDTKRGEKYARAKTARRWGYVPADED